MKESFDMTRGPGHQVLLRHFLMDRARLGCLGLLCIFLLQLGCDLSTPTGSDGRIQIVATVGMIADLANSIGGEQVRVQPLMGPGVDPHLFTPTRDDVSLLMRADLILYCGLHLEGKMAATLDDVAAEKACVAVTRDLQPEQLLSDDGQAEHADPHVWMDVALWAECCDVILDELCRLDPAHADEFAARAEELKNKLQGLDQYARESIASIPESQRMLITSHDAFGYLGRAYGLEVRGVQGLSTESAAGLQRVNELVDLIVERQVTSVFVESSVPQKSVSALVEGSRARGHNVRIGGELYSDAMGPAGSYEGTYIGMIDHNVTTVTRALGGDAEPGGWQGQLKAEEQVP